MSVIPQKADAAPRSPVISPSGHVLSRQVAFRFALDPTDAQEQVFRSHAGAARFTFNHLIGRASANLGQRRAETSSGIPTEELTPALSWSGVSMINAFTQFKNGLLPSSPVSADGERGLLWADQVSVDAFGCIVPRWAVAGR